MPLRIEDIEPRVDPGIAGAVRVLMDAGVETFESCDGAPGHAMKEPTVRFYGHRDEGFRALAVALKHGLPVSAVRRAWTVMNGEPTGPHWEMIFHSAVPLSRD